MGKHEPIHEIVKTLGVLVLVVHIDKRRNFLHELRLAAFTQNVVHRLVLVAFHIFAAHLHRNQIRRQCLYLPMAKVHQFTAPPLGFLGVKARLLKRRHQTHTLAKDIFCEGLDLATFVARFVFTEELKVPTVVENQEAAFVRIGAVDFVQTLKPLAQSGAAPNHLPKLGLGANLFEEDQIHHFRHINAGIHHIHRHGDVGFLLRLFEIVNDVLRIGIVTHHTLGKAALVLWIEHVKALDDIVGVSLVLRKNDGLAQAVAPCHVNAAFHQILQDHIHCGLVKDKLVQLI